VKGVSKERRRIDPLQIVVAKIKQEKVLIKIKETHSKKKN